MYLLYTEFTIQLGNIFHFPIKFGPISNEEKLVRGIDVGKLR